MTERKYGRGDLVPRRVRGVQYRHILFASQRSVAKGLSSVSDGSVTGGGVLWTRERSLVVKGPRDGRWLSLLGLAGDRGWEKKIRTHIYDRYTRV